MLMPAKIQTLQLSTKTTLINVKGKRLDDISRKIVPLTLAK